MSYQILSYQKKPRELNKLNIWFEKIIEYKNSNAFLSHLLNEDEIKKQIPSLSWTKTSITNCYYSFKNLISIADQYITGGSGVLENYKSPINSTVYLKLKETGAIHVLHANLDEMGMSGTGQDSYFGGVNNFHNNEHIIAGSSSGSAYLVSSDLVDFSICSDTGDSGRIPASTSNIYGFKPSYGLVSRYGFFPYCSQFDAPSIISKDLLLIAQVLTHISGEDPKDLNTLGCKTEKYEKFIKTKLKKKIKIGVFKESLNMNQYKNKEIYNTFLETFNKIKESKEADIEIIDLDTAIFKFAELIYIIVSYSESISNYLNINGLIFPFHEKEDAKFTPQIPEENKNFEEILLHHRSKFGNEFKFRQILGMHFLNEENYTSMYLRAKKTLTIINQKIKEIFDIYDIMLCPTCNSFPEKITELKKEYNPNCCTNNNLLANFAGLPSISMPWMKVNDFYVGLNVTAFKNQDFLLFQSVKLINEILLIEQK